MKNDLLNLISLNKVDKDNSTVYTENANDIEKRFAKGIKLNLIREERDMKAKKLIGLMLATALSVTSLAGCGNTGSADTADKADSGKTEASTTETTEAAGNESAAAEETASGERVKLEVWDWWGDGQYKHVIEQLCQNFNESQDKYEVVHVNYPWGDVWTKALAATAAGNPPDIIIQDIRTVTHRGQANQATDLTDLIAQEGEGFTDQFYPQLMDAMIYDGRTYGLPYVTDTRILYYDKDAFAEAGLDPEAPPQTWAELVEYARKLDVKNDDGSYDRLGFYPGTLEWNAWAFSADGKDYTDAEGNVTVNTPEKVKLFENIYTDFYEYYGKKELDSFTAEFGSGMTNPFVAGKVAMWVNTPTEFTKVRDFAPDKNYGVALMPALEEGGEHYSWGGGFSVEIPYGAKDVAGSWEFAKFITSKESQVYWASQVYDTVANIEASQDPSLMEIPVFEAALEAMPTTVVTLDRLTAPGASDIVLPYLDEIILGNKTPQEALDEAQAQVVQLVEDNK